MVCHAHEEGVMFGTEMCASAARRGHYSSNHKNVHGTRICARKLVGAAMADTAMPST